jgi:penicillin-binding protein 1A
VTEITSLDGETLYKNTPASVPVTDERYAHEMTYMLRHVVTNGTGLRADPGDRVAAGKTGTSQDNRDAWFVGYTANETMGVWFGNDDNSPTRGAAGGNFAAIAWRDYMRASQKGVPAAPLPGAEGEETPVAQAQESAPIKGFLSQLADLFTAAPRLEGEEGNFSGGHRERGGLLQTGGGRPR